MNRIVSTSIAALLTLPASEALACAEYGELWDDVECEVLVPRMPPRDGVQRFVWSRASHDERRDYLIRAHLPYDLANKVAVGGIPLQGQDRAGETGWYLRPSVVPRFVFVF